MTGFTNQQLVLTAIGDDRSGIVSELTQLISEANCNIMDSRIITLGNEFTLSMLVYGDLAAINRVEHTLPAKSMELGLLTMMKRTSNHQPSSYFTEYKFIYQGIDILGTLSRVTRIFAENEISICSLRSDTFEQDAELHMRCELDFSLSIETEVDTIAQQLDNLCQSIGVNYTLNRIR